MLLTDTFTFMIYKALLMNFALWIVFLIKDLMADHLECEKSQSMKKKNTNYH